MHSTCFRYSGVALTSRYGASVAQSLQSPHRLGIPLRPFGSETDDSDRRMGTDSLVNWTSSVMEMQKKVLYKGGVRQSNEGTAARNACSGGGRRNGRDQVTLRFVAIPSTFEV
jgi:hypothetical protein